MCRPSRNAATRSRARPDPDPPPEIVHRVDGAGVADRSFVSRPRPARLHSRSSVVLPFLLASTLATATGATTGDRQGPADPAAVIEGRVVDLSGTPVPGARVQAWLESRVAADTHTDHEGAFTLRVAPGPIDLVAIAKNLAPASVTVSARPGQHLDGIRLVLGAGLFSESVTVAGTPSEPTGATASTSVLDAETLLLVPGRALDDALATTPGFSLFRRSSSRVANPTAQGVSLRGLAASGASRALVLADGVPANDPFGGWVYWNRLPGAAIDRVEVARGGWSDRYGAGAMGGVVQVLTASAGGSTDARLLAEAGSRATGRVSGFAGLARRGLNLVSAVEAARAGRAQVVAARARGPIDTEAGVNHLSGIGALTWTSGAAFGGSARLNPFGEDRENGTPAQRNDTRSVQLALSASGVAGTSGWELRAWAQRARFGQTFSITAADRRAETPTTTQRVDSDALGARAAWNRPLGPVALVAGVEARQVHADNVETPTLEGSPSRSAGGRQRGPAAFVRLAVPLGSRVSIEGGGRWETWANRASGDGDSRRASSVSPRVSLAWRAAGGAVINASAYRAFRAPTLNELYRGFRVGSIVTTPNDALGPERLTGAEGGATLTRRRISVRATWWWSRLDDPVANVTIGPGERQRQNVGEVRAHGLETELVVRPAAAIEWTSSLALTRSTFHDALRPSLDGRRVPQVPGRQFASRLRLVGTHLWASAELKHVGRQYEDDLNDLPLSPASVIDVVAGWRVNRRLDVRAGIENVTDREVEVGRTPVPTIGLPRTFHVSVRINNSSRR